MSVPRFHVAEAALGARFELPEHSAHHARDVLRLASGAEVRIFDGKGAEYRAVLDGMTRKGAAGRVLAAVIPRAESPLRLVLALSPLKGDRMELAVQKATELGVAEIHPVVTLRTDAAARPALQGTRQDRWEKVASGAAEQSGRAVVPHVAPTVTLAEFLSTPRDGARVLLLETEAVRRFSDLPRPSEATILVGPAGGFDPREVAALREARYEAVSAGPRILRAETAAIAAVTAAQVLWGDLG